MINLNKMTRKQLASLIVTDQVVRGVVRREDYAYQVKARLYGLKGYFEPMTKAELLKAAQAAFTN